MAKRGIPLDERVHHRPEIIAWWVNDMGGQPMGEDMIHRYLTESPFFDYTTKNGLIFTQARTNHAADQLVCNRRAFEEQLSKQNGTEYMIVGEPEQIPGAPDGTKNGMYVIRKQDRKRTRMADGSISDELTTLGTYYVMGEMMFQARSVGDIVGNRLLSASNSLSKFFAEASSLPNFSPKKGYTYVQQPASKPHASAVSTTASPPRSRDGSVVPGAETVSLRSGSVVPESRGNPTSTAVDIKGNRLLEQTMKMLDSFGDEFMDENPILGEPGHFTYTSSTAAVKKRRADEEAAAAAAAEKLKQQLAASERFFSPKVEKPPSPPDVMTEAKALKEREKERRGSKSSDKAKRKKSKGGVLSPATPKSGPNELRSPPAG